MFSCLWHARRADVAPTPDSLLTRRVIVLDVPVTNPYTVSVSGKCPSPFASGIQMTHRPFTPSTPPFAFPAIMTDVALGRSRRATPGEPPRLLIPASDPAAIVVSGLFLDAIDRPLSGLTVMDLGAGAGRCGRILARHGIATLIAVDPTPTDASSLYADHIVGDLTALGALQQARLERHAFDGLVSSGALGPDGIPPSDFVEALHHVVRGGWICVAFDAAVLGPRDVSGYGALIRALSVRGVLEVETLTDFGRRIGGRQREQVALLARKGRAIYDA